MRNNKKLTRRMAQIGKTKRVVSGSPSGAEHTSDNFSFANFNWVGYNDARAVHDDASTLTSSAANATQDVSDMQYTWMPIAMTLRDGSETIAFKLTKNDANRVAQLANSRDSRDQQEVEKILLSNSQELLTTPSATDRMRGVRKSAVVVRTPSSLIDLMDDQVPDLREGFFTDPQDDNMIRVFAGSPPSIVSGLVLEALTSVAGAILSRLGDSMKQGITIDKIVSALSRVAQNSFMPGTMIRIIKDVYDGKFNQYLADHPELPLLDAIPKWIADEYWAGDLDELPASNQDASLTPIQRTIPEVPSAGMNRGDEVSEGVNFDDDDLARANRRFDRSVDQDVAYVPITFWRHLYSLGASFEKRNSIPNFSTLVLSGSPTTDLLCNRVPSIYIRDNGQLTNEYWRYGEYPMAGGLFSKIKKAVKKVGSAVAKVGKAAAKGVSRVMDSPLGAVISAVPVVGNIANVAGKVAGVVNKVANVAEKVSNFAGEDESSAGDSDQAGTSMEIPRGGIPDGTLTHPTGLIRGKHSDLILGSDSTDSGRINIAALPVWSSASKPEYAPPPMSLLTGGVSNLKFEPHNEVATTLDPVLFPSSECPTPLESETFKALFQMVGLNGMMDELEHRGPILMSDIIALSKSPENTRYVCGSPRLSYRGARLNARCPDGMGYWASHNSLTRARRVAGPLKGDPDVYEGLIKDALSKMSPMAEWLSLPSLTSSDSHINPFAATFFQVVNGGDTKILFEGGKPSSTAIDNYLFSPPFMNRFTARQRVASIYGLGSIIWAMLITTSGSLSDDYKHQVLRSMQQVAMSGAWTGRQIDDLVGLVTKSEWPGMVQLQTKQVANNWNRMIAETIAYIWAEAGASSLTPFSQAINSVSEATYDAIAAMGNSIRETKGGSQAGSDSNSTGADAANALQDIANGLAGGGAGRQPGQRLLDDALGWLDGGGTVSSGDDYNAINLGAGDLSDPNRFGGVGEIEDVDRFTSSEASTYWAMATQICRSSGNSTAARMRMQFVGLPQFIISQALMKYFPVEDNSQLEPMAPIPLSRRDYLTFGDGSPARAL